MAKSKVDFQIQLDSTLTAVLGGAKLAQYWMDTPNRLLDNLTPIQYLAEGGTYNELLKVVKDSLDNGKFE